MSNTPVPPAPATSSPSGVQTGRVLGTPGGASGPATGGAGAPPGTHVTNQPRTSGGTAGGGNQTGGSHMPVWKRIVLTVLAVLAVLAALALAGWLLRGCFIPTPPPVAPPIVVTAIIPPPPAPPPPDPDIITPDTVKDWCKGPYARNWVFVGPEIGVEGTLVVPVCHNPNWTARPDRRVTPDGRILRVAEGEGSSGTNTGTGATPGGPGWKTMGTIFQKKVLIGKLKDQEIRLYEDALVILLPPATMNPVQPFKAECDDLAKEPKPPSDRWLREIWARCRLGGQRNTAVAVTMARSCSVSGCFSRDDGAALDARVRRVETAVAAAGDKPVQPQQVGYDPSAPSR